MMMKAPTYRPGVPGHRCCNWNALGSISNSSLQWHQPPITGRIIMFSGAITVQSTSTIMAVGLFGCVKLLPLVDRTSPPYITGISDQDYLALRAGHSQSVGGGIFLLQLLETLLLSGGPPPGSSFLD